MEYRVAIWNVLQRLELGLDMAPGPKKIVSVASWQHLAIAHALGDVLGHLVMQSIYLQLFHVGARGQTSFMDVTSKSQ